ncbi:MAG: sigma-70 family RNA polymerase sigma factor [Bacteroidales bacterium]|nr:sigma-70 family RNA polymerase sigma factor [Candidatus Physcousia equi]
MDSTEFKQRYMPFHKQLYGVAYGLTQSQDDAEDLLQELYLRLWKKRDRMPPDAANIAYLATAMRNLFFEQRRAKDLHTIGLPSTHEPACADTPELHTQWREAEERTRCAINALPQNERIVMEARVYNDFSYEEIERNTGLSPSNIRQLMSRARKKMRELLRSHA